MRGEYNKDDKRLNSLFASARKEVINTSAQEAHFETRLMARISEIKSQSVPWHLMIWRLIPGFAVIAGVSIVCSIYLNPVHSGDLFAPITSVQEEILLSNVISGE